MYPLKALGGRSFPVFPLALLLFQAAPAPAAPPLTDVEQLGRSIFFDERLSLNGNQSCASCHDPEWGWTGPDSALNALGSVYEGSIEGRFGNCKPPSSAYATFSPIFHLDARGPPVRPSPSPTCRSRCPCG